MAFSISSRLLFCCLFSLTTASASPFIIPHDPPRLAPREFIVNNNTGTLEIFNPDLRQVIPQGRATDGGGTGFDLPAILWIAFTIMVGLPMAVAGIRGWRFTTGVGIGLATTISSWAAFVNTVPASGIPDIVLALIIIAFFFFGFVIGLFEFARVAGITFLGITGGLAVGIRIMIIKENLLFSSKVLSRTDDLFGVTWAIIAVFGLAGGLVMLRWQRAGIMFGSASVGTFLAFLSIDLLLNRQSGMSRGLRYLMDRNISHVLELIVAGYKPPLSTQILLSISLALTPAFAYWQHRVFKQPFSRKPVEDDAALNTPMNSPGLEPPNVLAEKRATTSGWSITLRHMKSRFSM